MATTISLTPIEPPPEAPAPRPVLATGLLLGAVTAWAPLIVLSAVGLIGWFISDAGAHGSPRSGLRVGALTWLAGHGTGLQVGDTVVSVWPLGITLMVWWVIWRLALRTGVLLSSAGPDRETLADGGRDWTVLVAFVGFAASYLATVWGVAALAGDGAIAQQNAPSLVVLLMLGLVAFPAIAIGSGRAAIWADQVPAAILVSVRGAVLIVRDFFLVALVLLLVALVADWTIVVNIVGQLELDTGDTVLYALATLAVVPNAVAWSGSYLLGTGFSVGSGTLVTPQIVAVGPLPLFALLAALPDQGAGASWAKWLYLVPSVVAAWAVWRNHRRFPTHGWLDAMVRGAGSGVLAAGLLTTAMWLSGGTVGPGRMQSVGPFLMEAFVQSVTALGCAGLFAALAVHALAVRGTTPEASAADD